MDINEKVHFSNNKEMICVEKLWNAATEKLLLLLNNYI